MAEETQLEMEIVAPDTVPKALAKPEDKWERLLSIAVERNGGAEQFAMLVDAITKARREDARLQFEAALGRVKQHLPVVFKTKKVSYANKDGSITEYWHAELDKVAKLVGEELGKEEIVYSWKPGEGANGRMLMTCVFRHSPSGHVEEMATLGAPPDSSGGKNSVQAIGSSTTYLQRYTLLAAVGVVPKGVDDDGKSAEEATLDYKPVDEEIVKKRVNQILAAGNDMALKVAYQEALKEAGKDEKAKAVYSKNKNQRYRELHTKVGQ